MEFQIADLFESLADAIGDRDAVVAGDTRLTYAQLDRRANRVANWLRTQGIGAGDHIGVHMLNGAEFLEIYLGAYKIRAVPININYRYVAKELVYVFDNADLKALFTQQWLVPEVAKVKDEVPSLRTLCVVEDESTADLGLLGATSYEAALASVNDARDFPARSGDDLYILYTGGTTGMPKGVMWRHEDVFFAGLQGGNPGGPGIERPELLAEKAKARPGMTMMPLAPFIHGAATWAAFIGLFGGGKVVIVPGKFDPNRAWQLAAREGAQTMTMVGDAMARPLIEAFDDSLDLSRLMIIASAGAVLSDAVKEDIKAKLPRVMIMNSFGSSESGHNGHALPGMDKGTEGHVSFKMDSTAVVLDEETLQPIEPGSGKLGKYARSGRLPLGYYKDEAKTAATFVTLDGTRYCIPGDYATVEKDGRVTLFGRGAACINSGGQKVFPEEVESALKAHEAVMDVLVVGLPDEQWGQRVAAVIQPRAGRTVDFATIDAHAREHVAGFKCPKEVYVCEEVARQPSGKPDYKWALEYARAHSPVV